VHNYALKKTLNTKKIKDVTKWKPATQSSIFLKR
jgi:hypothetical protein